MRTFLFWFGLLVATLVGSVLAPGLDFLTWHLLQPAGFWQKLILIAVELVTLGPRVGIGFFLWLGISALTVATTE